MLRAISEAAACLLFRIRYTRIGLSSRGPDLVVLVPVKGHLEWPPIQFSSVSSNEPNSRSLTGDLR